VVLQTGRIAAAEALLRWTHPERGAISPAEFIPVAEQSGLIVEIGAWVLDEACRQLCDWRRSFADEAPDAICVNLSVKQLLHGGLTARVQSTLTSTGLEPSRLKLEITESVMIDSTDMALRGIAELKTLGTRILIDDFGTGYSSLSYLARLAPDGIKVDRSFVDQMSRS